MTEKSFREIFGEDKIGQMWKNKDGLIFLQNSPIEDIKIRIDKEDNEEVSGTVVLDDSEFADLPWIKTTEQSTVTLQPSKDAFDLEVILENPTLPFFKDTPIKNAKLRLVNEIETSSSSEEKERRYSSAELLFTMHPDIMDKDIILSLSLFQGGGFTQFRGEIPDGMSLPEGLSVLSEFLGVPTDFATYIPEGLEFIDSAKLYSLSFSIENNNETILLRSPQIKELSFEIGIEGNLFSPFEPYLSFRNPRLFLSYLRGKEGWSDGAVFGYVGGQLVIGNKNSNKELLVLNTTASFPVFDLEIQSEGALKVAELAESFDWNLPDSMKDAKIEQISAYISPSERNFQAGFQVNDALDFNDVLKLESIALNFGYGSEILTLDLDALLHIESEGNDLLTLSASASVQSNGSMLLSASFYNNESSVYGYDQANISLDDIYQALFHNNLPEVIRNIQIKRLSLSFSCGTDTMLTASSYGLSLEAEIPLDTITEGLKANATVSISNTLIDLKGQFLLKISQEQELELTVAYRSEKSNDSTLSFYFMFDRFQIELKNSEDKLTSSLNLSGYTLGEAAIFITKLFNPSFSLGKSDEWSFLYNIQLVDTDLCYNKKDKSLTVLIKSNITTPFLTLKKAGIMLGKNGVQFLIEGKFLDEEYGESNPLKWDTNSTPPATSGKLLDVSYLALANNIAVSTQGGYFSQRLSSLKEQLPINYLPEDLKLSSQAGYLFALDSTIMDTVEVKLLYHEEGQVIGAGFKLVGEKAKPLTGLAADILYARINDSTGLFSGYVIPPSSLRNIDLGAIRLGIGDICVQIYTNGDFYIDLGFPHNQNFNSSFSIQYGIFVGRGGIWVKRDTLCNTPGLEREGGYYSPILGCGIGLQIGLARGFNVGILNANLSLTLTGIFEGTYATFLYYSGNSTPYYKVSAMCSLSGNLSGTINFGPIGAGVSIRINSQMRLELGSEIKTVVNLDLRVSATASIRIGWWWLNFSCNISFSQTFTLGNNDAIAVPTPYPDRLTFPLKNYTDLQTIPLLISPILSSRDGKHTVVFLPSMQEQHFRILVERLVYLASYNNCMVSPNGLALFMEYPLFCSYADLEQFLSDNFLFTLDFSTVDLNGDSQKQVCMPMPPYVIEKCLESRCDLQKDNIVNAEYLMQMREYYKDMEDMEDMDNLFSPKTDDYPQDITLSYHIFSEYFEIIIRALHTEKAWYQQSHLPFDEFNLTDVQLDNIIGMTQRFLFGSKRVPDTVKMVEHLGPFDAAGQQFFLEGMNTMNHMASVSLVADSPQWLKFSNDRENIEFDLLEIQQYLPSVHPPTQIFSTLPAEKCPFTCRTSMEVSVNKTIKFKDIFTAFPLGEQDSGKLNALPIGGIGFASIIQIYAEKSLLSSREGHDDLQPAVYELQSYENMECLHKLLADESNGLEASLWYLPDNTEVYLPCSEKPFIVDSTYYRDYSLYLQNNSDEVHFYADLESQPIEFLKHLRSSYILDGEFMLAFLSDPVKDVSAVHFALVIQEKSETPVLQKQWHSCFLAEPSSSEITLTYETEQYYSAVKQGYMVICAEICNTADNIDTPAFLDNYQNLTAMLADEDGNIISGETVPVFSKSEKTENGESQHPDNTPVIPYYRFLEGGKNIYAGIQDRRQLMAKLFLVDVLGNRSEEVGSCTIVPTYTDLLVPIRDYPGLAVSFYLEYNGDDREDNLAILYRYQKDKDVDSYMEQSLAECICQLEQVDVVLHLYSPLFVEEEAGVLLYKEPLLEFLHACAQQQDTVETTYIQKVPLPTRTGCIKSCEAQLVISRDRNLCHASAPTEVDTAVSSTNYSELSLSGNHHQLPASLQPLMIPGNLKSFNYIKILKDKTNYSCIFLESGLPIELGNPRIWAWVDMPVYTGLLDDKSGLCVECLDLQVILNNAWEDLNDLLSSRRLQQYRQDNEWVIVDQAFELQNGFAGILASYGFAPLYDEEDIDEEEVAAMGRYVLETLSKDSDFPFREVIFAQSLYNCTPIKAEHEDDKVFAVARWDCGKSYDGRIDLSQESGYFCAACVGENMEASETQVLLQIHSIEQIEDSQITTFETADTDFWSQPLPAFQMEMISRSQPVTPVFLSQERRQEESLDILTFQWSALHKDHLQVRTMPPKDRLILRGYSKNDDESAAIYDMFLYNEMRRELLDGQGRDLANALEGYLDALLSYFKSKHDQTQLEQTSEYDSVWTIYANDGYLNYIKCDFSGSNASSFELEYQVGNSSKDRIPMRQEQNIFYFEKDNAPAEGQAFSIFLRMHSYQKIACELRAFRREDGVSSRFTRWTSVVGNAIEEGEGLS